MDRPQKDAAKSANENRSICSHPSQNRRNKSSILLHCLHCPLLNQIKLFHNSGIFLLPIQNPDPYQTQSSKNTATIQYQLISTSTTPHTTPIHVKTCAGRKRSSKMLYVGDKTSNTGRWTDGGEGEQQIGCPRIKRKRLKRQTKAETKGTPYRLPQNRVINTGHL